MLKVSPMTNETGLRLADELGKANRYLKAIARDTVISEETTWNEIASIVARGDAREYFDIGTQFQDKWKKDDSTEFNPVLNVTHFGHAILEDQEEVRGMYLQWDKLVPDAIVFDEPEAIYYTEDGLAAGTYHFAVGAAYGTGWTAGLNIQITLTQALPAGGQIRINVPTDNAQSPIGKTFKTYGPDDLFTEIETGTVAEGTSGTDLGTTSTASAQKTNGQFNAIARVVYGNGRYKDSFIRQWLNADAEEGEYWQQMNPWDRPAAAANTLNGFLWGCTAEFKAALKKVKITTALNTVEGYASDREDVYDKIFIPGLEQMYISPQLAGAEGEYWEYWKEVLGRSTPAEQYGTYEQLKMYPINSASAAYYWLRSANRGNAYHAWYIYSSGYVNSYTAYGAFRCASACILC